MKFYQKLAKKTLFMAIWIIAVSFLLGFGCLASEKKTTKSQNIFLPENVVYENIYAAAAENLNINAQMKDDVYVAGLNVEISGPVEGDVIVAGSNVVINSEIKGNLRVLGGTVIIKGKVAKNVTVAGGMVNLAPEAEIGKSLILAGGNAEINGKVNKNIYGAAGNLSLNGNVLGSAYLAIDPDGILILYPAANIAGNLEYTAKQPASIMTGAKIGNEEKFTEWQIEKETAARHKYNLFFLTWWLAALLGALVVGLVTVIIFKDFTIKVQKQIDKNILMAILRGLAYLILTPIALLILAITIIGLPLALILGAIYAIVLFLTKIFVGIYLGEKVIRLFNKKIEIPLIWSVILGLVLVYLACLIPYLGWLIKLIIVLWGLGVLVAILKKDLKLENS